MDQPAYLRFEPGRPEGAVLLAWWNELHGHANGDEESQAQGEPPARAKGPNYRGERAELRRCGELAGVVLTPAYQRLYYKLRSIDGLPPPYEEGLATVSGVLAQLEHNTVESSKTFAGQLAQPRGDDPGGPRLVSELRFRRLLQIRERRELYPFLVRLVRQLGHQGDLFSLAQGAYGWGDAQRKRWAYEYYAQAFGQG